MKVRPLIEGRQVSFLGEADATLKRTLYKKAAALLLPLQWDEPFGLVMVEAMACGTPVLTFDRGAVREIVVHGETGFIGDTLDDMVAAINALDTIDPRACRQRVARCFSRGRMADRYERLYAQIVTDRVPALVQHPEQVLTWGGALEPAPAASLDRGSTQSK